MNPRRARPYQLKAVEECRTAIRRGARRVVLMLPTGGGKTFIAGQMIQGARERGQRCLFTVPTITLIDQSVESFWRDGLRDLGVMQATHPMTDAVRPVQIASVQTLARRAKGRYGLVIVDECHRQDKALLDWLASPGMKDVPVIGLSATPWAKGMANNWEELIISTTTREMIAEGYLSPFRVFAADHPDLSGVHTVAGDYNEGELGKAMNKKTLVANVVETWLRQGKGEPTLCFAVDCAHAKAIQAEFEAAGVPCGYVDAFTDINDRKRIGLKLERGEYKVVCNVGTLTTGVDWIVRCVILARPTKSEMLFVQIVGRGLRPEYADGFDLDTPEGRLAAIAAGPKGEGCLILDHSDTHSRLGFVTDIIHHTLDDGKPKKSVALGEKTPKECPKCHFLKDPGVLACPQCGFKPEAKTKVEVLPGQLVEMRPQPGTGKNAPPGTIRLGSTNIPYREFFAELRSYGYLHRYKSGWAAAQYKDIVGDWPPRAWNYDAYCEIRYDVTSYVKSRMIRWIKGQEKARANG